MLAEIGIMVGFYIMTKMLALEPKKDGSVSSFTRVFSAVTFVITCVIVIDLIIRGVSATNALPAL